MGLLSVFKRKTNVPRLYGVYLFFYAKSSPALSYYKKRMLGEVKGFSRVGNNAFINKMVHGEVAVFGLCYKFADVFVFHNLIITQKIRC